MMHATEFSTKLTLVLKALNLSRGQVAHDLGVHKSLVGRWASGAVQPSSHNLARLSALIAGHNPNFSMADWDKDLSALAQQFEVSISAFSEAMALPGFPPSFLTESLAQTGARGAAYEGFWRTNRPSVIMAGTVFRDQGMIRLDESGRLGVRMGGAGMMYEGVILPHESNLYAIFHSPLVPSPYFLIAKGVAAPRAERIEGLLLLSALDSIWSRVRPDRRRRRSSCWRARRARLVPRAATPPFLR
jgi:transcriptional regulator with XRE-family HTH domain